MMLYGKLRRAMRIGNAGRGSRGNALSAAIAAALVALGAGAAEAAAKVKIDLPHHPKDGMSDVRRASDLGAAGKWDAGRKFIDGLRARPAEALNLEERQSVDMAEFALLRHGFETNRARAVECLRSVYDAGCTSFWGWAAYTYLKDCGEEVAEPPKDPLRGLGKFGDGVVNMEVKRLGNGERGTGNGEREEGRETGDGRRDEILSRLMSNVSRPNPNTQTPPNPNTQTPPTPNPQAPLDLADLQPGSPVRREILRKRLVETCGREKIGEILASENGEALFSRLWDDDAVLEDFLLSGPVFNAPLALETLMTLFLNDEKEGWSKTEPGRRATVAVAINAKKDDDMEKTVRHWAAFRRIGEVGGFVKEAAKRDCREWRFIVRRPADAAETLYLNAMRRFPTRRFYRLLLSVPYRKSNCFGVGKWAKGDEYMRPWTASGLPRLYLRTRVGGVCVEQSSWAARAANSQGIMAETAHQPGRKATRFRQKGPPHLAWIIRGEDGVWRIQNNIRPFSGASFVLWGKGYQYVQSVERAFADRAAHDESELLRFAGRVREAAMRCPYNWPAWRAYTDELKARGASVADWRRYLRELLELQPEGRLVTWNFAFEALDAMAAKKLKKNDLAEEAARVFAALPQPKSKIGEEMNFERDVLERAMKMFRGFRAPREKILAAALAANRESPSYLPQTFAYAVGRFAKDRNALESFFGTAAKVLGEWRDGESSGEKKESGRVNWRRLCSVRGCGDSRAVFRMMADLRNEDDPPTGAATVPEEDYGAPLASGDALVATSSGGKGDTPEDHARVSDATPYDPGRKGLFATKAEEAPWAIVELAGAVSVKGVTVVGAAEGVRVWLQDADGEWREAAHGASDGGVLRVDLREAPVAAKSVKVGYGPELGKKSLGLKKILVYGDRLF